MTSDTYWVPHVAKQSVNMLSMRVSLREHIATNTSAHPVVENGEREGRSGRRRGGGRTPTPSKQASERADNVLSVN